MRERVVNGSEEIRLRRLSSLDFPPIIRIGWNRGGVKGRASAIRSGSFGALESADRVMKPTVIVKALATLTARLVIGVVKPRVEPGGTLRERGRERVRGAGERERPGRAAGADGDLELGASAGAERELGAAVAPWNH